MSQVNNVDVLVIGLGPAGSSAAERAARAGARVLAVDRKAVPGIPVQCAEFVPTGLATPHVVDSERQTISAMRTQVEDETADLSADFRGRMIDRARFDAGLVERARAAGADCRFDTRLQALSPDGIATLSDGSAIDAPVIVGADGPRSRVGRTVGLRNRELVEARQITVALGARHDATDIYLSARIPGGYAWLFPKGDVANLGIGVAPSHRRQLKPLLETLHRRLVQQRRVGADVLGQTGGAIPVGGIVGPSAALGERLLLLAGDAAGLANPVTGAGIPAAVMSGQLAGDAARAWLHGDRGAGTAYAEDIDDVFGVSLARALARRRELLQRYGGDHKPDNSDLRRAWIAYPQYWTP